MGLAADDNCAPAKRAYRIPELKPLGGPGHDKAYKLIAAGRLRAVKSGRSTLILAEDFERYLQSLPAIVPRPQAKSEPAPRLRPIRGKR